MTASLTPPLACEALSLAYDRAQILDQLDLTIPEGRISVLVGANGCGKSTLLKSIARLLRPSHGRVMLSGRDIHRLRGAEVARKLAILPQGPVAPEGLSVEYLVRQGRYPHQNWRQQWTEEDETRVARALADTQLTELAARPVDALSGGQRQRAWIAMALAQNTGILLLDEPTTYLDLAHQIEILDLIYELNRQEGTTILMVLHDLNLAARYADELIAIREGRLHVQGAPEEVMTPAMLKEVFGLTCDVIADPLSGTPMCIPHGGGRRLSGAR